MGAYFSHTCTKFGKKKECRHCFKIQADHHWLSNLLLLLLASLSPRSLCPFTKPVYMMYSLLDHLPMVWHTSSKHARAEHAPTFTTLSAVSMLATGLQKCLTNHCI